jgi:bacterioferritin-associated ferredoxin
MQRVFIFAKQVEKIIAAGKSEIEIPEGASVSAAAADLIKDHKLKIITSATQIAPATDAPQTEDKPVPQRPAPSQGIALSPSEQKPGVVDESQQTPADDDDIIICRCEEITKGEIKAAIRNGMQTVNGIKRITRAGMGLCQGQTCQRLVIQIIAEELRQSVADIEPTTARGPVRPLKLAVFANS